MKTPRLICILGAESTGKTTLVQLLSRRFDCPWVPEYLRQFCHENARTPRRDEQAMVLQIQRDAEIAAQAQAKAHQNAFVFCDTAPMLTAIYSDFIFGDKSLLALGRSLHVNYSLTLLLAPDIDWVPDGLQRDGEHVRAPVHECLRQELAALALPVVQVEGSGDKRLAAALEAVHRL